MSRTPPVTQIQYWLAAAPPQAAAPAVPQQAQPAPQPSQQPAPSQASAPASSRTGTSPTADQAIDTVNKLRGLFGR